MKNSNFVFHGQSIKINTNSVIITRLTSVKSLLLITALLLMFVNAHSQNTTTNSESANTSQNIFADELQNSGPEAIFCINGNLVTNNQTIVACINSPIQLTLCDVENGVSPLSICWTVNGNEDCEAGLDAGDVLFESTFEQGTYSIQITSITDSRGNSAIGLNANNYSFEIVTPSSVSAGEDITVCENETYVELNGLVENGFSVWEEALFTGGFFENANATSTKYYFSNEDIELGTIELCLTGIPTPPCFIPQTDCINVTITRSPEVNAGSDVSVCANEPVFLNQAVAENYSTLQWSTMGDGVFVNPNALNTVYLPGMNDLSTGEAQLCLNANAQEVCTNIISDCITIDFIHAPAIDLAAERSLVYEDYDVDNGKWLPVEIGNTISGDYQSIVWMTNGDGTFDDATAESPAYFPGLNDTWNGEIVIYVNIEPAADCHNPIFQGMTLHIPQQFVYYSEDGWNGISSYLSTDLSNVTDVMDPLVQIPGSSHLVSMFDAQGRMFMPEFNPPLVTLTSWEPVGYKIKLKNTNACLPIYGDSLANQTFTVDGPFTYLPTLTNIPVSIESLFEGHINDVMFILEWSTNKLWTPVASDFDSIYPGYAYLLVNNSGIDPYTIEFPDFVADAPLIYPAHETKNTWISNSPWAEVEKSDLPQIFTFTEQAMTRLQPGDILGAFNQDDECFGVAEYGNTEAMYKLIAMGKNSISSKDNGFEEGEAMNFKVYNYINGQESEVTFIFDENYMASNGTFMSNSLSLVTDIVLKNMSTGQSSASNSNEVTVYPNPASDQLNITSGERIEEVLIMSVQGQEVRRMHTDGFSATLNVSDLRQGVYVVIIKNENQKTTTQKITIR